jgi:hypothetical protein
MSEILAEDPHNVRRALLKSGYFPLLVRVQKVPKMHSDGNLPSGGGTETATLFSIFDQSVISIDAAARNSLTIAHYVLWWLMPIKMTPSNKSLK